MLKNDPILQPLNLHGHLVPGIWQYMLPAEVFRWKLPDEREATCMSCPRTVTDNYRKDYRCCTYQPAVPNYALGLALKTKTGLKPVRKLIASGAVLPEGSLHTPQDWYNYLETTKAELFGNNDKVLCQLLDPATGFCNIYAFRNAVCSTFFCIHDHDKRGAKFWEQLQELVGQIESVLQQWVLCEIGFDLTTYFTTLDELADDIGSLHQMQGGWSPSARKKLWGKWYGREEDLLKACGETISSQRKNLWTIANEFVMQEASVFERQQLASVPSNLKGEVDESDWEEGESVAPKELWTSLKRTHSRLWIVPERKLVLNKRVEINENAREDKEERFYKKRPYELLFLTSKDPDTYDWRNFISQDQRTLLQKFQRPRKVSARLLRELEAARIKDPAGQIAEWVGKKVLIPAKT